MLSYPGPGSIRVHVENTTPRCMHFWPPCSPGKCPALQPAKHVMQTKQPSTCRHYHGACSPAPAMHAVSNHQHAPCLSSPTPCLHRLVLAGPRQAARPGHMPNPVCLPALPWCTTVAAYPGPAGAHLLAPLRQAAGSGMTLAATRSSSLRRNISVVSTFCARTERAHAVLLPRI